MRVSAPPADELQQLFESLMVRDVNDIAVRYTILSHLLWLATEDEDTALEQGIITREDFGVSVDRETLQTELGPSGYRSVLQHFLSLLLIEQCNDWNRIRWELDNCRVCQNTELVLGLLSRAEAISCHDGDELLLIRAQFRFLITFVEQVDTFCRRKTAGSSVEHLRFKYLVGNPELYSQDDLLSFLLLLFCIDVKEAQPLQPKEAIDRLASASFEIETALRHRPEFEPVYRPVLARCQFATSDFARAAASYQLLLKQPREDILEPIKFPIYAAIARCHELAGNTAAAIATLEQCANQFPKRKGLYLRLAALNASAGQYQAIPDLLRKEMSCDPDIGEEWQVSTILALAEVSGSRRSSEEIEEAFFKAKPDVADGIRSVVSAFWPTFRLLSQASQNKWIYAMSRAYFHGSDASFSPEDREVAAAWFAKAVELELRNRLFLPFRQHISQNRRPQGLRGETENDRPLVRFVEDRSPKLMFGQMHLALEGASNLSASGVCRELRLWMESKRYHSLFSEKFRNDVGDLARLAGFAKHDSVADEAPRKAHELSQRILQAILAVAK